MMDGEVRTDEMVWGFGEGVDATVCSMSPIYRSDIVSIVVFAAVQRTLSTHLTCHRRPWDGTDECAKRTIA